MPHLYHFDHDFRRLPQPAPVCGSVRPVQVGRCYCAKDSVIRPHRHADWWELTVVSEGAGMVETDGVSVRVGRGDIYLSFPSEVHAIASDPDDPLKYDYLSFVLTDPAWQERFSRIAAEYAAADRRVFQSEPVCFLVRSAIAEFSAGHPDRDALLTAVFSQILIYLSRKFRPVPPAEQKNGVTDAEALCFRVMDYLDTHLHTLRSLTEAADALGYSYGYLTTLFRRTTDRTLSGYYNERRMESARALLAEGRLNCAEIAALLNYSSLYAFSKAFRRRYGASPRKYGKPPARAGAEGEESCLSVKKI